MGLVHNLKIINRIHTVERLFRSRFTMQRILCCSSPRTNGILKICCGIQFLEVLCFVEYPVRANVLSLKHLLTSVKQFKLQSNFQ